MAPISEHALAGITVIDITGSVATAYCGKLFADHGATVINVEPERGFPTRYLPPYVPGAQDPEKSALHAYLSTNKSSVVLDVRSPDGFDRLGELLSGANLLLEGETPGEAIDIDHIRSQLPDLIVNSISWFGQTGPYARFNGSDAVCQSLAGLVKGIGKPDSAPLLPTGFQAQIVAGLTAFIPCMVQVLAQELGNRSVGTHIDTSVLEANLCFTEVGAVGAFGTGYRGMRWGVNRFPPTYPLGIYPCQDGWLGITTLTPAQWLGLCELLDLKDQASERRYLAVSERLADADKLDPIIAERVRDQSARALFEKGQAMRIPLSLVPTMAQLFETGQYVARGAFADITLPAGGTLTAPVTPFRLFETPAIATGVVKSLGADSVELLGAEL